MVLRDIRQLTELHHLRILLTVIIIRIVIMRIRIVITAVIVTTMIMIHKDKNENNCISNSQDGWLEALHFTATNAHQEALP